MFRHPLNLLQKSSSLLARRRPLVTRTGAASIVRGVARYNRSLVMWRNPPRQMPSDNFGWSRRLLSFSFAGPRKFDDIIKKELIENKSGAEIADIWYTFHEARENVHGLVYKGNDASAILSRAGVCPFFVQPIFRDDGFFMMICQFQRPNHFLMAYLEDYKMDPAAAQPLLTFSIFDDLVESKDLTLVRCDILNKGLHDSEGRKLVENMLDAYRSDVEYASVEAFNRHPNTFNVDDYIAQQSEKWKKDPPTIDAN